MISGSKNIKKLNQLFNSEDACIDCLFSLKWPNGFKCVKCKHTEYLKFYSVLTCKSCYYKLLLLSGTIFESSKRPLTIWFRLIWDLVSKKNGINAKDLSNEINLNYHMVWISLHKLRRTLVQDKQTPLTGNVEIGEFLFGAFFDSPSYGRLQKVLTTVAMELKGEPLGKTRLQIVQSDKSLELLRFIHNNVKQGSSIITEDKNIYSKITSFGYTHVIQNPKNDKNALPHVQEVFSMFDEWILKILYYKRSAAKINLPYYFDEFAFLFNKRETKNIYLLFHQFFANAINFYPVTVKKFAMFLNLREAIYKH